MLDFYNISMRWTVKVLFSVQFMVWVWLTPALCADIIYFTDGMRTLCHGKAWEEKDEVYCEYDGGLLIYPKKDVARLEKDSTTAYASGTEVARNPGSRPVQPSTGPASSLSPAGLGPPLKQGSAILFYDPRRPKKYWSSTTAQHESYREALAALAVEFNRPPPWIESHMGESNDLQEIRENLRGWSHKDAPASQDIQHAGAPEGIEFYNPRRQKKYWTAADAQHDTLDQAIGALAAEFGKPADWIELHMGDVNDVNQIRQSLKDAAANANPSGH
jgi:hypothetical protein